MILPWKSVKKGQNTLEKYKILYELKNIIVVN